MKYEWRKNEKDIYLPKTKPTLINIPKMKYFMVDGKGDPNNSNSFKEATEVLYTLSYTVKMMPKKGININGYYDYTVYPLEGIWDLIDTSIEFSKDTKDNLKFSLMIRQPDFITDDIAKEAIEMVKKKKNIPLLNKVRFETLEEGLCMQMMHIGPYDDEAKTFAIMEQFCNDNNIKRISKTHKEIYISDFRKTAPNKLKTVLRFMVENK